MSALPTRFARNVSDVWGAPGREWLDELPPLLEELAERWSLTLGPPYPDLSYNYVAPAELPDGSHAVLKVGFIDRERKAEMASLPLYGPAMVRVIDADAERGALLLERLELGTPLTGLVLSGRDDKATETAAGILQSLWKPVPEGLEVPSVREWAAGLGRMRRRYDGGTGPLPPDLVEQAECHFHDLSDREPDCLLHGDFHHGNILSAERLPWVAIDPKGLTGPCGYDAGNFVRSNVETFPNPRRVLDRRLGILSDALGIDREVIRRWGIAQGVLSAWWSIEDHGDGWQETISVVRILDEMGAR